MAFSSHRVHHVAQSYQLIDGATWTAAYASLRRGDDG